MSLAVARRGRARSWRGAALLAPLGLAGCPDHGPRDAAPDAPDADGGGGDERRAIGAPCEPARDGGAAGGLARGTCAAGQLCLPEERAFPGGYCAAPCAQGACEPGGLCVALGRERVCLRACRETSECRFDERYRCLEAAGAVDGGRACVPIDAPTGLRDGGACFTTAAAAPHALAPLERRAFGTGPDLALAAGRPGVTLAAEGNVAVAPGSGAVAVPYIALGAGGGAFVGVSTVRDGTTVLATGRVADPARSYATDPVAVYTRDGALNVAFLALNFTSAGAPRDVAVMLAASADDGQSFGAPSTVAPAGACDALCDKPWLAAGPAPVAAGGDGAAAGEHLYVAYGAGGSAGAPRLLVQRSEDGGRSFADPVQLAPDAGGDPGTDRPEPNLVALAVGPDGALHAAWVELHRAREVFGDVANRVVYRRSRDGGRSFEAARVVAEAGESVVYAAPAMAADASGGVHVAYVAGVPRGAWDVVLASSADGGASFRRRRVNDEPESCATHFLPALVVDPARRLVHAIWLENRFGDGAVAYAACPLDPAAPCGRNERVGEQPFTFTTSRDPMRWHGDYAGLGLAPDGALWAAWSDTRTGRPAMFLARGRLP